MNIDYRRERCLVPELDESKLRRVAFCVDVEIAGGPRYKDEGDTEEKKKKRKEKKLKERGEGEALKHPEAMAEEKEKAGVVQISNEVVGSEDEPNHEGTVLDEDKKETSKKKEKKKRSEAERKERKEKKRRKAEENGSIPLELTRADDETSPTGTPAASGTSTPKAQDRPTTDPLRIYRRCCQLRETPILKRISDQLSALSSCAVAAPGVVPCLDLTGSRLQLADVVTLGDWLAVVPVKKLLLEDADLTDEKTRIILAGLLAAKSPEAAKRRSWAKEKGEKDGFGKGEEQYGIVEKLTLKNNPKITKDGWKHISLFIYMCKSLKAIDVSMIAFPQAVTKPTSQTAGGANRPATPKSTSQLDTAEILYKAISERLAGSRLEELIMAECSLNSQSIRKIIDGVTISGLQRLGLAGNDIDSEGLDHIIRYVRSGVCHGLDLGGNDLRKGINRLCEGMNKNCPLWALSLADCNLTPESLQPLFLALVSLPNFRFLDLSHNRDLFSTSQPTSLCILRKYLPQLKELKRLHLLDVSISPAEAIGLAEILPECDHLAHLNILENPQIAALSTGADEATQEEACALYASLMAAVRVSDTIICIDVDVPGPETSEVVKALAKQVDAYCLRNMERMADVESGSDFKASGKEVEVPEVLMHLVGHVEGVSENHDDDEPAPDDDYIVGGTGVVKALSYCLLQKASDLRRRSLPASGTATPRGHIPNLEGGMTRAKNMSKNLLSSARNIRARLQPALVRESKAGNEMAFRRLLFLDQTLQGMIQRFEDEYPECRLQPSETITADNASTHSSTPSSTSPPASSAPTLTTSVSEPPQPDSDEDEQPMLISRLNSDVSLASRALSLEEGRIHRLGQRVRNEILNSSRPTSSSPRPDLHSALEGEQELPNHLQALCDKLYNLTGEEMRATIESDEWEETLQQIGQNAEELERLEKEAPEEFKLFREAQMAAIANAGKPKKGFEIGKEEDVAVEDYT